MVISAPPAAVPPAAPVIRRHRRQPRPARLDVVHGQGRRHAHRHRGTLPHDRGGLAARNEIRSRATTSSPAPR